MARGARGGGGNVKPLFAAGNVHSDTATQYTPVSGAPGRGHVAVVLGSVSQTSFGSTSIITAPRLQPEADSTKGVGLNPGPATSEPRDPRLPHPGVPTGTSAYGAITEKSDKI